MIEIKNIIQGATNKLLKDLGVPNEAVEELAAKRLALCRKCINYQYDPIKLFHCKLCGCKNEWQIRSDKECVNNYWLLGKIPKNDLITSVR